MTFDNHITTIDIDDLPATKNERFDWAWCALVKQETIAIVIGLEADGRAAQVGSSGEMREQAVSLWNRAIAHGFVCC